MKQNALILIVVGLLAYVLLRGRSSTTARAGAIPTGGLFFGNGGPSAPGRAPRPTGSGGGSGSGNNNNSLGNLISAIFRGIGAGGNTGSGRLNQLNPEATRQRNADRIYPQPRDPFANGPGQNRPYSDTSGTYDPGQNAYGTPVDTSGTYQDTGYASSTDLPDVSGWGGDSFGGNWDSSGLDQAGSGLDYGGSTDTAGAGNDYGGFDYLGGDIYGGGDYGGGGGGDYQDWQDF